MCKVFTFYLFVAQLFEVSFLYFDGLTLQCSCMLYSCRLRFRMLLFFQDNDRKCNPSSLYVF